MKKSIDKSLGENGEGDREMKKENGDKIILDLCGGTGSWSEPYRKAGYKVFNITLPECDITKTEIANTGKIIGLSGDNYIFFNNPQGRGVYAIPSEEVYGILAAPPCTMFSFARTNAKKPRDLQEGMECVRACLDIIWKCMEVKQPTAKKEISLKFWALENPYHGFLKKFLGKPVFIFDPWEFGDGYQKRTALWGHFSEPKKNPIPMTQEAKAKTNSYLHTLLPPEAKSSTNRGKPISIWKESDRVKFDYLKSKDIHPEAFGKFDRQTRRSITPQGFAKAFFNSNR